MNQITFPPQIKRYHLRYLPLITRVTHQIILNMQFSKLQLYRKSKKAQIRGVAPWSLLNVAPITLHWPSRTLRPRFKLTIHSPENVQSLLTGTVKIKYKMTIARRQDGGGTSARVAP